MYGYKTHGENLEVAMEKYGCFSKPDGICHLFVCQIHLLNKDNGLLITHNNQHQFEEKPGQIEVNPIKTSPQHIEMAKHSFLWIEHGLYSTPAGFKTDI